MFAALSLSVQAAKLSYAKDLAAASSSTTAEPSGPGEGTSASRQPEASTSKEAGAKPEWKPKDPYAAYTSAASLGIEQDPEALRREEDLERRKNEGFAGEWQAVSAVPLSTAGSPPLDGNAGSSSVGQTAYPHSDGDESRNFVLTERVASLDPEDDDGGLAEIRVKKRIRVETRAEMEARAEALRARELPVWTPMRFERGGISNGAKKEESPSAGVGSVKSEVKEENAGVGIKAEIKDQATDPSSLAGEVQTGALKPESPASTAPSTAHARALADSARSSPAAASIESNGGGGGGLFRKRKAGAGAGAKKVRALV